MISLTIQFRTCWIARGIDRFDVLDQVVTGRVKPRDPEASVRVALRDVE